MHQLIYYNFIISLVDMGSQIIFIIDYSPLKFLLSL